MTDPENMNHMALLKFQFAAAKSTNITWFLRGRDILLLCAVWMTWKWLLPMFDIQKMCQTLYFMLEIQKWIRSGSSSQGDTETVPAQRAYGGFENRWLFRMEYGRLLMILTHWWSKMFKDPAKGVERNPD